MSQQAKEHYEAIKERGELTDILPSATGDWEKDKSDYIPHYNENVKLVADFENGKMNISIDDIDNEDFDDEYE